MSAEDIDRLQQPLAARGAPREVIVLAWPVVLNMLSITMMGTADTFFVGRIGIRVIRMLRSLLVSSRFLRVLLLSESRAGSAE